MLCLGPKKSLLSPRLELAAQGMAQCTNDKSQVWYHSASLGILMTTFYGNLNLFSHMGNFPGLMFFWNHIIIIYYD